MNKSIVFAVITLLFLPVFAAAALDTTSSIAVSLVNQDPDPAIAGDIVEIRLGLTNVGGAAANDMIVEIEPGYPFESAGESLLQNVGTLLGYQGSSGDDTRIVKFKLRVNKDAPAGTYELKVKTYQQGAAATITRSISIDIKNKQSAEVIYIDQVELIPGKITPLKFTIHNVGSAPLRELTFQWENEEDIILPVGSDNTKYIKYIEIGDSEELLFEVIASANADPDLYKLDLTLTYEDPLTSEETTITSKAGVYVGGATDFDIAYSGTSSGETSFSISNVGSVAANSVTVRIPEQRGWKVTGSNSVIIGNLNEGDYTIASFTVASSTQLADSQASGQAPNRNTFPRNMTRRAENNTITLEIIYTDSRGNRNTITKTVPLDTTTSTIITTTSANGRGPQRQSTTLWNNVKWAFLIIAILAVLIIFYYRHRKARETDAKRHK